MATVSSYAPTPNGSSSIPPLEFPRSIFPDHGRAEMTPPASPDDDETSKKQLSPIHRTPVRKPLPPSYKPLPPPQSSPPRPPVHADVARYSPPRLLVHTDAARHSPPQPSVPPHAPQSPPRVPEHTRSVPAFQPSGFSNLPQQVARTIHDPLLTSEEEYGQPYRNSLPNGTVPEFSYLSSSPVKLPTFDSNRTPPRSAHGYLSSDEQSRLPSGLSATSATSVQDGIDGVPPPQTLPYRQAHVSQAERIPEPQAAVLSSGISSRSSLSRPEHTQDEHAALSVQASESDQMEYVALQYHHQDLEQAEARLSRPMDGVTPVNRHLLLPSNSPHGRVGPIRPDSTVSSVSDTSLNGSRESPSHLARHSRAVSAHSHDSRHSYVEHLNAPYPQPAPAVSGLDNTHLQNIVGDHASLLRPEQTLALYRQNARKTNDMGVQYEFALYLIEYAKELAQEVQAVQQFGDSSTSLETTARRVELLKEARQTLERLSNRSYPYAQYYLGDAHSSGMFGKPDNGAAFRLFVSAAKHGHAEAAYRAALCYEFGWGCRIDPAKAVDFYKAAASKNHPGAMLRLGKACCNNDLGFQNKYKEGIKWLKRASESADVQYPQAPYELGLLHETGFRDLVFQDEAYTAQLFTLAASLGHVDANYRLGDAYEHGKLSCPKDAALSVHYYTGAAMKQHPAAMMALCAWYMVGAPPVLDKDEAEAYEWAKKAAEYGLGYAEYAVGHFTEMGIGTRRDPLEANVWYVRAADHGDQRAKNRLAALAAATMGRDGKASKPKKSLAKQQNTVAPGGKNDKDCIIM